MLLVLLLTCGQIPMEVQGNQRGVRLPSEVTGLRAHEKLDSNLSDWLFAGEMPGASYSVLEPQDRSVQVVVEASVDASQIELLLRFAGAVEIRRYLTKVQGRVSKDVLSSLVASNHVRFVSQAERGMKHVATQGLPVIGWAAWQAAGSSGDGVRVGVIDGGFADYRVRQAAGELPTNLVTQNYCAGGLGGDPHGTAVAEIIHDIAPQAQLHLICVDTTVDLGLAKDYAQSQGIHIVSMSIGFPASSRGDGSGSSTSPEGIVADALRAGILWVNSVGNHGTGHWSGTFIDSDQDGWHEFADLNETNTLRIPIGREECLWLKWDSWPVTALDYDLYLYRRSDLEQTEATPVASSRTLQTGSQPPREHLCYKNFGPSNEFVVSIQHVAGAGSGRLDLYAGDSDFRYFVTAGSVVEPATSPSALAVGAVCWSRTTIEPYSSQGPTIDGRVKPDITAPTGVSTASYGSSLGCFGFSGTSASAPHVAGAAALVKQANPAFAGRQIQDFLEGRARDLGAAGKDNTFGAGLLALGQYTASPGSLAPKPASGLGIARTVLPNPGDAGPGFNVASERDYSFEDKAAVISPQPPYRTGGEMLQAWGWQAASERELYRSASVGVYAVVATANVYASASGAAAGYALNLTNLSSSSQPYTTSAVGSGVGDQSAGFTRDYSVTGTLGGQVPITEFVVAFRSGRVSSYVSTYAHRGQMDFEFALRLVRLQAVRSITLGQTAAAPVPGPLPPVGAPLTTLGIYGVLTDSVTGAPVSGVCVTLGPPIRCHTTTDGSGNYAVDLAALGAPSGSNWELHFVKTGEYEQAHSGILTVSGPTRLDFKLQPLTAGSRRITMTAADSVVGTAVSVAATVQGGQVGNVPVTFVIDAAATDSNPDLSLTAVSNGSGLATISYTRSSVGSDTITASLATDPTIRTSTQVRWLLPQKGRAVYLPNVTKSLGGADGWQTPFIVQNIGAEPTDLELQFFRFDDGQLAATRQVIGLRPGTSFAEVPNADDQLASNSQFSVVIRSTASPIVAVVNEHGGSGAQAQSLSYNGFASGTEAVYLPYIKKSLSEAGLRLAHDGWLTTFIAQNLGQVSADVTIRFVSLDGAREAALMRVVPPGRSVAINPSVEAQLIDGVEYSAVLTSNQPLAVVANAHRMVRAAPVGYSYGGVGPTTGDTYVPYVARAAEGGRRTTRLVIQNASSGESRPVLALQPLGGGPITRISSPRSVPAGQSWSYDPRYRPDQVTPCATGSDQECIGEGEYSATITGGPFAVLVWSADERSAFGYTGMSRGTNAVYMPNVTRNLGGPDGWSTPLIIQSVDVSTATVTWYRFRDGSAAETQQLALVPGASVRIDPRSSRVLADGEQYSVTVRAAGRLVGIVTELSGSLGDSAMVYEGFPE